MATLPAINPTVPFLARFSHELRHGLMIRINGEMLSYDRFNVNLQNQSPHSNDINLHLSVRPSENAIVRNHFQYGNWGPEERHGGCPIQFNQPFEILILAENECFKIAVNGRHFCEFHHRLPLSTAHSFYIDGSVKVYSIKVEGDVATAPPMSAFITSTPSYQQYQPPPYQPNYSQPTSPYVPPGSVQPYPAMSSTTYAVPSMHSNPYNSNTPYHTDHHQPYNVAIQSYPQQQFQPHHQYQQFPAYAPAMYDSGHVQKSNTKSNALKYAAGIGAAGIGAYALTQMFSDSCSDSD